MKSGFLSFVKKECLHLVRDARTMLVAVLIPTMLTLLFGFAISTEVRNIDVAISAPRPTETVRRQVERLDANPYITVVGSVSQRETDDVLRRGQADAVVMFADDYDRSAEAKLLLDASNPNSSTAGMAYIQNILLADKSPAAVMPEIHMLYNPQMKSAYNFVPGIMGMIFMLICAMMTSVSIVREKEMGTMEVLLVSPVRPIWIIISKMVPFFLLSCLNLTMILLLSRFVLDVPMSGSLTAIILLSILYLVLALAFGLFISTLCDKQAVALLISAMLMLLPVVMLSGMIFPVENLPGILQALSCIIPARWYIEAMRRLMIEGLPVAAVAKNIAILSTMTVVVMVVALKKFNDKLE